MEHHKATDPLIETLDAIPRLRPKDSADHPELNPAVAIVTGSTPELSRETNSLLQVRLRAASLIFFAGFLAFFVRRLFFLDEIDTPLDWVEFSVHLAATFLCGLIGLRLCRRCPHMLRHLRAVELLLFGGSALFLLLHSCVMLLHGAERGYVMPVAAIWLMLIFIYALFIPNTLRRAALTIAPMAAAPVLVMIGLVFTSRDFVRVLENPDFDGVIFETAMFMCLAGVAAVWGAHMIGSLRREAFEARQLGQYRLKHKIGEGGMGEVYLAEHVLLKRPCAIKLIRPDKAGDGRALARFEREVKQTAKLTHWNTIEIFDYGRAEDGTFYYVMQYLPGLNLGQLVEICGPLPPGRVIHLLMQTCDALREAHAQGLIHRDIKPANVFAARLGGIYDVAKLLDFGLAKPLIETDDSAITQEGTVTGSPLFMSPEQATGSHEVDGRSDIYSLGVVAYYLLCGQPPFLSDRPFAVMMAHARDEAPRLSRHQPDVPADLEQIVMRCLEKDPEHRFQDVESLRLALADCHDAGTWTREMAIEWWQCNGCPKKKALDAQVLQATRV